MARWIECKKCGHKYQNNISRCPKCYTKTPITPKKIILIVLSVVFALLVALGFVLAFIDQPNETTPTPTSSVETPSSSSENKATDNFSSDLSSTSSKPSEKDESEPSQPKTTNTSTPKTVKDEKIIDSDGFVTGSKNQKVEVKVPKWLLLSLEPNYDYKITATDKEYGVVKVNKNSDGSATFVYNTYNDYQKTLLLNSAATNSAFSALTIENSPIVRVEKDSKYKRVKLYTKYNTADEIDDNIKLAVIMVGLTVCNSQIFDCTMPLESTFEFYNQAEVNILSLDFPKAGELFYSAMQK